MEKSDFETSGRTLRWYEWLTFLLLFALVAGVRADPVYKCTDAQGDVAFQSQPCSAAQREGALDIPPAPAYSASPEYALTHDAGDHAAHSTRNDVMRASHSARSAVAESYECRAADGQVFYRHSACPHSIAAAQGGSTKQHGHTGAKKTVSVSSYRVTREEACSQMRRAGAAGRSGREHDEDVSTYDKNLGRDPCR